MKQKRRIKFKTSSYEKNSNKTRTSNAKELLAIAKELQINSSDADLVLTIGRQFEIPIQETIKMQGIRSYGNLYDLLQAS